MWLSTSQLWHGNWLDAGTVIRYNIFPISGGIKNLSIYIYICTFARCISSVLPHATVLCVIATPCALYRVMDSFCGLLVMFVHVVFKCRGWDSSGTCYRSGRKPRLRRVRLQHPERIRHWHHRLPPQCRQWVTTSTLLLLPWIYSIKSLLVCNIRFSFYSSVWHTSQRGIGR